MHGQMNLACLLVGMCWGAGWATGQDEPRGDRRDEYFEIQVLDQETGRGVPLVELTTVHHVTYVTDSAGRAAVWEPGLMGQDVFFSVKSHGYEFPRDGFGIRGARLKLEPGGRAELKLRRLNRAERLYRVTGGGIYRDSLLLGYDAPIEQPLLNGQVLGQDSVLTAVFRDQIYWFWGDTNRPSYPLGNFHVPGATSELPSRGGLDPSVGVNLRYFVDEDGFAKPTCQMPGDGPTWLDGLTVLPGRQGEPRMLARYAKIRPPLEVYERGLVEFDHQRQVFQKKLVIPDDQHLMPEGHPLVFEQDGVRHAYFAQAFPLVRVPATAEAYLDLSQYETYTCALPPGGESGGDELPRLDRTSDGRPRFAWRQGGIRWTPELEDRCVRAGLLSDEQRLLRIVAADSGQPLKVQHGSVAWNDYRRKFVMIFSELFGSSVLGEVWYSEAPRMEGPWRPAVKIVTHDNYSFYNPRQHPMLAGKDGRYLYFEGTYTATFAKDPPPTPRYNYNQVMYRLDLASISD